MNKYDFLIEKDYTYLLSISKSEEALQDWIDKGVPDNVERSQKYDQYCDKFSNLLKRLDYE